MARKARNPGVGKGAGERVYTTRKCGVCGGDFLASRSDALACKPCGNRKKDRAFTARGGKRDACPECGEPKTKGYPRCFACARKLLAGENNPAWKGGKTMHHAGYVAIRTNRLGRSNGYELEHRLVWEAANGPIPRGQVIHHLNGLKTDNRLENLAILSNSAHRKLHEDVDGERSRYIQSLEARIRELEGTQ